MLMLMKWTQQHVMPLGETGMSVLLLLLLKRQDSNIICSVIYISLNDGGKKKKIGDAERSFRAKWGFLASVRQSTHSALKYTYDWNELVSEWVNDTKDSQKQRATTEWKCNMNESPEAIIIITKQQ